MPPASPSIARSRLRPWVWTLAWSLAAATGAVAESPQAFVGRVVDERTGTPIGGAVVSVVGLRGTVRADGDGRFEWTPSPPLPFQLVVTLPGGQVAGPVSIDALDGGEAVVLVNPLVDEAVTVLGVAPSIDTSPAAGMAVLSSRQIAQRNPGTLMQALEGMPGVSQVSEGHAAVPAVRGLARGRTLIVIDGARVSSERRVGPSATFLDPSTIEGLDVARGPGSVAYGSDALGGVVSIRTRRAEPGSPLRASVTGTLGAGVPNRWGAFEVSKGFARGGVLVRAHVRSADDYRSPEGTVFNSGWSDRGVLVHASQALGEGLLSASWQGDFGRDVERPRNNSRVVRFSYPFEDSHRITASWVAPEVAGFRRVETTAFYGRNDQRTDQDRVATASTGRSLERADVSANDFQVKSVAERLVGTARLTLGVDVNGRFGLGALEIRETYSATGTLLGEDTTVSIDSARRVSTGAFAQVETQAARRAHLSGGTRVDRVTSRNVGGYFGDRSSAHAALSGFGAVTLGPFEGVRVTAQLARGFRDPTLSDRYYRGPTGRGFITGNPDLRPETSLQLDLAVRYAIGRHQLAVYGYQYRIADLVERYQTGTDFFFFRNRGRARLRGAEVELRSELGRGYAIDLGAHLARGDALDDGAPLDDVPARSVSVSGRRQFGARGDVTVRLARRAAHRRPGPSEVAMPGATLVDLGTGWRLGPRLEVRALARNLLNERSYASPDPRWVLAPGRSATLTTTIRF